MEKRILEPGQTCPKNFCARTSEVVINLGNADNGGEKITIFKNYLSDGETYKRRTTDEVTAICLHHTAGRSNPDRVVSHWDGDVRGRIATHYVVGGKNGETGDTRYDGKIVEAMDPDHWAWHLGALGRTGNVKTTGIEICSAGGLKQGESWFGTKIEEEQIEHVNPKFRGYSQFMKYSDAQLKSTKSLLLMMAERDNIDLKEGLVARIKKLGPRKAFNFDGKVNSSNVSGIISHTNVKATKSDVFPQTELIDMLLSI
jgi:N-acetyl-anhydromuramyl-L-alanine amidase AmpD